MSSLFLMIAFTLPILFLFMNHPLSFGLILLMQTLMVALITGLMSMNFWFSYILFLIMVGGMLILFIYMTSIASNEKFKLSKNLLIMCLITTTTAMMISVMDQFIFEISTSTNDLMMFNNSIIKFSPAIKFFNFPSSILMIMMFMYLLLTLIMVAKITNIKMGPLRQKI